MRWITFFLCILSKAPSSAPPVVPTTSSAARSCLDHLTLLRLAHQACHQVQEPLALCQVWNLAVHLYCSRACHVKLGIAWFASKPSIPPTAMPTEGTSNQVSDFEANPQIVCNKLSSYMSPYLPYRLILCSTNVKCNTDCSKNESRSRHHHC